jgi:hypothetical protein
MNRFTLTLRAGESVPPPNSTHLGWHLASGLICQGPAYAGEGMALGVHALAQAGDLIPPGGPESAARALMPSVLVPLQEPNTPEAWRALLARTGSQHRRQAADLTALRTGPAADRVRHLLLMVAAPDAPPQTLPSLRSMAALLDIAPETVSRVLSALRQLRLLDGGPPDAPRRACQSARQLKARPLPAGLTSSQVVRRPPRLRALATVA